MTVVLHTEGRTSTPSSSPMRSSHTSHYIKIYIHTLEVAMYSQDMHAGCYITMETERPVLPPQDLITLWSYCLLYAH